MEALSSKELTKPLSHPLGSDGNYIAAAYGGVICLGGARE